MQRYPRDLHGYGATPPDPAWPDGAALALSFVLNVEEGGENCLLHGDGASEAFLSEIVGAQPWPGQRHWNMESIYDYGARAGFWRLHRLFTQAAVPVTVFGVATALARAPAQVAAMVAAGWDIASHGLKWIEHKDMTTEEERAHIRAAADLHAQVVGSPPTGWYTGRCSQHTVDLVAEEVDPVWQSDSYADDLPYWQQTAGDRWALMVPYTLDANDMRFATPQGFNAGDQFEAYLKDSLDVLLAEGRAGSPKMMSVGLHSRLVGRPGRVAALHRFLAYARAQKDVWITTRSAIAQHWRQRFPAPSRRPGERPSRLDRASFVARFGGVFEHSAWIAEGAHALELGAAHDTALGLHNALARVFRAATVDQRLAVLRAHPDLAGKLAAAGHLTADSTAEQASAGLDALTDEERQTFTQANDAYTSRFDFPFILAVRGLSKADILDSFRQRLTHDRETEFAEACRQVEKIALLRLQQMLP